MIYQCSWCPSHSPSIDTLRAHHQSYHRITTSGGTSPDAKPEEPTIQPRSVVPVSIEERYKLMTLSGQLMEAMSLLHQQIGPRTRTSWLSRFEHEMAIRAAKEGTLLLADITRGLIALRSSDSSDGL